MTSLLDISAMLQVQKVQDTWLWIQYRYLHNLPYTDGIRTFPMRSEQLRLELRMDVLSKKLFQLEMLCILLGNLDFAGSVW